MAKIPVRKDDARRLAAARGVKFTVALRELELTDPRDRHALVLAAEAGATAATRTRDELDAQAAHGRQRWYDKVAAGYAEGLLRSAVDDHLAPPDGLLPSMDMAWYALAGVVSVDDEQLIDTYEGGELYNLTFTLELRVEGVLERWIDDGALQAADIQPLDYTPKHPEVRLPAHQVRVEVAGLLDRGNDDPWKEQELLGYDWLDDNGDPL